MPSPPTILATKLYPPTLRPGHLLRSRLVAQLNQACPLTLIAAPLGFGKSTLIAEWQGSQPSPPPLAWLALDADDNDLARFLAYVCHALGRAVPGLGLRALALLEATPSPPLGLALMALLHELEALNQPAVLVLDDFHVIEARPVHEAVTFLIEHLPPAARLVITTRADPPLPLARWRVRGQLSEIRAHDLRFTPGETAQYLGGAAGQRLSPDEMAHLGQRTEGWIAGLQLAALSLQGQTDHSAFVAAFGGSNRYVLDYLTEEVLLRQPEAVQTFLLRTSILDRLCAPLCDALLADEVKALPGEDDLPPPVAPSPASAMLEVLERANLFIVPLDADRQWYRYHPLFAEALRNRLRIGQGAALASLHQRASAWYAANDWIGEAVHHALAAGDHAAAAQLIGAHGMNVFMRGQVARLARWLDQVPTAVRRGHPPLNLLCALTAMAGGQYAAVEPCLLEIEAALSEAPDWDTPDLRAQVLALRAAALSFLLDPRALELVRQALHLLPDHHPLRPVLLMGLGNAQYAAGDLTAARATLQQTLAGLPDDERVISWRVGLRITLVFVLMAQGRLDEANQVAHETVGLVEAVPLLPGAALFHAQLGALAYEQSALEEADRRLAHSLALARSTEGHTAELYARSWLACLRQAQGQPAQALEQMDRAEALARQHQPTPATLNSLAGRRAYLWLAQGSLRPAADWAAAQPVPDDGTALSPFDTHRLAGVRVLIARDEHQAAQAAAADLLSGAEAADQGLFVIRSLILLALAQAGCGRRAAAFGCLERALSLAEPQGYVRTFLDEGPPLRDLLAAYRPQAGPPQLRAYAEHLLRAFTAGSATPPAPPARPASPALAGLVEPLSPRELEVLRLVAEGYNNPEIAVKLVVGVSTVKKHINGIFGKLGATHRAQAIARARSLGML